MHMFLEYLPLIIFFLVNKFVDFYWATASLIASTAIQLLYYRLKKEKIPTRHWIIFGLVFVFGGLTIYLQDDAFIKWKVTIINMFFALALVISNAIFKKNIIKQFLGEALTLPEPVWNKLNLSWAAFFAFIAVLNLYVAFNFELDVWVNFKVFGLTGLMFVFAITSVLFLYKYMPTEDETSDVADENASVKNPELINEASSDKK